MKKTIIFLFLISILFLNNLPEYKVTIPKDSIRFRIIANSNEEKDQLLKWDINKDLIPIISKITKADSIYESRNLIKNNIYEIESIVKNKTNDYSIKYGENYFPTKKYNDVIYEAGNYESVVITLGAGAGDNWWCVLFPPLCLLEASQESYDELTYSFYIKDIIKKYS